MSQPADRYASAFTVEPGTCSATVHGANGQATHCAETATWTGAGSRREAMADGGACGAASTTVDGLTDGEGVPGRR
jgi:hypothetical protein